MKPTRKLSFLKNNVWDRLGTFGIFRSCFAPWHFSSSSTMVPVRFSGAASSGSCWTRSVNDLFVSAAVSWQLKYIPKWLIDFYPFFRVENGSLFLILLKCILLSNCFPCLLFLLWFVRVFNIWSTIFKSLSNTQNQMKLTVKNVRSVCPSRILHVH